MKARLLVSAAALALLAALTGCGAGADGSGGASSSPSPSSDATESPGATTGPSPSPSPTAKGIALPTDCRAILSEDVLDQLDGIPLNDAAFGPSGVAADGSLTCNWADPAADTTRLTTTISKMNRGPALDMLNALADTEGFTCFTPDDGTRCEKTWQNEQYPVTDGRTLFWREDVLIDTRYSNLAPSGYTSSIVEHIFG
ncbi:hypothetical protein AB3M89_08535 [Microbacterium sp. 179-I 3D2 NHS]|uniref:hypothetical protein n=1 Tax=Microbacterium sp. 179-I 3D2 NHS TaxID=3235178 RepID=UPI0039A31D32